jgi:putative DNA methylase
MNKQDMTARLIEADFPLRTVSEESVREKNIRHGHISTLHIWWARRPLAASRATALAALLPDDPRRREGLFTLLREISPWEAVANGNAPQIEKARRLLREAFGGRAPRVLDCFAGGGAIPLEALRLGCETYALDYNPVAVLINKAVLEFPQKFGRPNQVKAVPLPPASQNHSQTDGRLLDVEVEPVENPLLQAVSAWGKWILEEARKELEQFYPKDADGSIPVGYIWARTLPCQNPACGTEIPLMRQTWLAKKIRGRLHSNSSRTSTPGAWGSKSSGRTAVQWILTPKKEPSRVPMSAVRSAVERLTTRRPANFSARANRASA